VHERSFWDTYMQAYGQCLTDTSTEDSPWFEVPADDKQSTRLIVSRIVLDVFESMDMSFPVVTPEHRCELGLIRHRLEAADG